MQKPAMYMCCVRGTNRGACANVPGWLYAQGIRKKEKSIWQLWKILQQRQPEAKQDAHHSLTPDKYIIIHNRKSAQGPGNSETKVVN